MNRYKAWIQVLILLCTYMCIPTAFAAPKADLDYTDLNQLAQLETTIFGSPRKSLPNEKRVDSLEKILFGKSHDGPIHPRLRAIATSLNGSNGDILSPPMAPGLDRENSFKSAPANLSSQSDSQKDESDIKPPSEAKHDKINNELQQATQLYSQGQTSQAENMFKNVLALDHSNADANFNLGAISEGRSDWEAALNYYQTALRSSPEDPDTRNAVASMKAKVAASTSSQKQNPNKQAKLSNQQLESLKAKVDQASNDYASGNYDSAITNLKTVLAQAPDQADVYYALGQAYKAKKDKTDAVHAFSQAVKFAPNNQQYADALAQLGPQASNNPGDNRGADTFSSNNPDLGSPKNSKKSANNNLANKNDSDWTPETPGEITPFSNQGNSNELGWQPAATSSGNYTPAGGMTSSFMPGYSYSNYIPYNNSMTITMERAAFGGLAGAAIGSMLSPPGYRTRGAFTGGMVGGMMGMMGGHSRSRW